MSLILVGSFLSVSVCRFEKRKSEMTGLPIVMTRYSREAHRASICSQMEESRPRPPAHLSLPGFVTIVENSAALKARMVFV